MNFDHNTIAGYRKNGYVVVEDILSSVDIDNVRLAMEEIKHYPDHPTIIREEDGEIRSVFSPQQYKEIFYEIYTMRTIVEMSKALVGSDLYLYQYKLNLKNAFSGKPWEWHQDYAYWQMDDGVPQPDMLSVLIYLNDTRSYQGPLIVIPGSHKQGVVMFQPKTHLAGSENLMNSLGADLKYTVHTNHIKNMADENGIHVLEAKAGTAVFFHANLFHASWGNLSPYNRDTLIITYNSVNNTPKNGKERPDFLCARDYSPIQSGNLVEKKTVV